MMDFYKKIYAHQAAQYEQMVAHEDFQGNIHRTLAALCPFRGLDVVEIGAGTGRLTLILAPHTRAIRAFDLSPHMLAVATARLRAAGLANWGTGVADNRRLPVAANTADMVIGGWTLGHSVGWYPDRWRAEIGLALDEMERVVRDGGTLVVLETLGTGRKTPKPPTAGLAEFYTWMEKSHGFRRTWIRTDYRFDSPAQAAELTRFFFGDALADRILQEGLTILPECTGVWTRTG